MASRKGNEESGHKKNPNILQKTKEKIAHANEATQATLDAAQDGQTFHEEINKCVIGYAKWPVLSNTGIHTTPELIRGEINPRTPERKDLQNFWNSTNSGKALQPHAIEYAIVILVSRGTVNPNSVTFDTSNLQTIQFNAGWAGLTLEKCTAAQRHAMPVLANGGYRLDLMRQYMYAKKLKVYDGLLKDIAKIDETNKGARSRAALVIQLEELRHELRRVTWVAKLLDKDRLYGHTEAALMKLELASNKVEFHVEEKLQNSLALFFDALNAHIGLNADNIYKVLRAVVQIAGSKGQRMAQALSSLHLTYAYSRLCYNNYFRREMPFSTASLKRWRRAIGAYAIVYINWMALMFEFLFSAHLLTQLPDITQSYETYFNDDESHQVRHQVRADLKTFDDLSFYDKQVRLDLLDDEFYGCLLRAHSIYKDHWNLFGFNQDQMTEALQIEYTELFDKYYHQIVTHIRKWVHNTRAKHANDAVATKIIHQLENKIHWLLAGQIGAEYYHPCYATRHPLVITEFIIPLCDSMAEHEQSLVWMASQFEPLAWAFLQDTNYVPGTPTLYSVLWNIQHPDDGNDNPHETVKAINVFLGTMYRFRYSGLEDMQRYHAKTRRGPFANTPPYLLTTPKFSGPAGNSPILRGMEKIMSILSAVLDEEPATEFKAQMRQLQSKDEENYVSTHPWLMKRVILQTSYPWEALDITKGSGNRTNNLRRLARFFWIATHVPFAKIKRSCQDDSEPEIYEGWDAQYLKQPRIVHMIQAMTGWTTWYPLAPIPEEPATNNATEPDLNLGFTEDLTIYQSMRTIDTQIDGANSIIQSMYNQFMKNPVFHCFAIDHTHATLVKTLKRPVAQVLQNLYQVCEEELGHTAKHLLQTEYDYEANLSLENRQMIHDRLLVLHEQQVTPTFRDLSEWHSPNNMADLVKTEQSKDPDLERLQLARAKRGKITMKQHPAEKIMRRVGDIPTYNQTLQVASTPQNQSHNEPSRNMAIDVITEVLMTHKHTRPDIDDESNEEVVAKKRRT